MFAAVPGDSVVSLVRSATDDVLIAAPFIKIHTLRRIVEALPNSVSRFRCVTRWCPKDIADGFCDIEIYDDVLNLAGGTLFVHPCLHAKYYRAANRCLIGSANLTDSGLGWSARPNVELLVELSADSSEISQWEENLLNSAIPVTEELRDQLLQQANSMKQGNLTPDVGELKIPEENKTTPWIPSCPAPERLWEVYQGKKLVNTMIRSTLESAQKDLTILDIPHGLSFASFNGYIHAILGQMPFMAEIDKLAHTPEGLTEALAHSLVSKIVTLDSRIDYSEVDLASKVQNKWHIIKSWITHFFPRQYRLESTQETLVKGGVLNLP